MPPTRLLRQVLVLLLLLISTSSPRVSGHSERFERVRVGVHAHHRRSGGVVGALGKAWDVAVGWGWGKTTMPSPKSHDQLPHPRPGGPPLLKSMPYPYYTGTVPRSEKDLVDGGGLVLAWLCTELDLAQLMRQDQPAAAAAASTVPGPGAGVASDAGSAGTGTGTGTGTAATLGSGTAFTGAGSPGNIGGAAGGAGFVGGGGIPGAGPGAGVAATGYGSTSAQQGINAAPYTASPNPIVYGNANANANINSNPINTDGNMAPGHPNDNTISGSPNGDLAYPVGGGGGAGISPGSYGQYGGAFGGSAGAGGYVGQAGAGGYAGQAGSGPGTGAGATGFGVGAGIGIGGGAGMGGGGYAQGVTGGIMPSAVGGYGQGGAAGPGQGGASGYRQGGAGAGAGVGSGVASYGGGQAGGYGGSVGGYSGGPGGYGAAAGQGSGGTGGSNPSGLTKRQAAFDPSSPPSRIKVCINGDASVDAMVLDASTNLKLPSPLASAATTAARAASRVTNRIDLAKPWMPFLPTLDMWNAQQVLMLDQETRIEKMAFMPGDDKA